MCSFPVIKFANFLCLWFYANPLQIILTQNFVGLLTDILDSCSDWVSWILRRNRFFVNFLLIVLVVALGIHRRRFCQAFLIAYNVDLIFQWACIHHTQSLFSVLGQYWDSSLCESSFDPIPSSRLLDFLLEHSLLDPLILGQEIARSHKFFQILWFDAMLQLKSFNFGFDDGQVDHFVRQFCISNFYSIFLGDRLFCGPKFPLIRPLHNNVFLLPHRK